MFLVSPNPGEETHWAQELHGKLEILPEFGGGKEI